MNWVKRIELARVDETLTELSKEMKSAKAEDRPFFLARIDFWLDQRLALMK